MHLPSDLTLVVGLDAPIETSVSQPVSIALNGEVFELPDLVAPERDP